ncbi:winged helix-turn-helix transcriptional regulator [Streptomyces sp. NPDC088747]|uniref:winged helix-turn-helix transcriptional regulator n=1 Tax=Streptomyces sp. NPDC088747 TaxID=3365886 RepID=UPI0037F5C419
MSQSYSDVSTQVSHTESCSFRDIFVSVTGKWSVQIILLAVTRGPIRFTELERSIPGISRRMLTVTLRQLERNGLIIRTVHPTVPPKVEYTASDMARELESAFEQLGTWVERHHEFISAAQEAYDSERVGVAAT